MSVLGGYLGEHTNAKKCHNAWLTSKERQVPTHGGFRDRSQAHKEVSIGLAATSDTQLTV